MRESWTGVGKVLSAACNSITLMMEDGKLHYKEQNEAILPVFPLLVIIGGEVAKSGSTL